MRDRPVTTHVVFDLDGTLVDSCSVCIAILSEMLAERGAQQTINPVDARGYISHGGITMISALLGAACGHPESDLAEFRRRYQLRATPPESIFPGVFRSLVRMKQEGLELAICSNKPQNLCEKVLADTGLAPFFSVVVGGQPGMRPKPFPDLLRAVLDRCGVAADDCVFIGDSKLDLQIAQTAMMPFFFMTYGYGEADWQPEDCLQFDCFEMMTDAVLSRSASISPPIRLRA